MFVSERASTLQLSALVRLLCEARRLRFSLHLSALAATRDVPSSRYPAIQSGVDAARNGDTALVAGGAYSGPGNRDIDFTGKSLAFTSLNGPTKTIIDGGGYKSTAKRGKKETRMNASSNALLRAGTRSAVAGLALLGLSAHADTITQVFNIPVQTTDFTKTFTFKQFDTLGGTRVLDSIELDLTANGNFGGKVTNDYFRPETFTVSEASKVTFTGPDATSVVTNLSAAQTYTLLAPDATLPFGPFVSAPGAVTAFVPTAHFGQFIGTGLLSPVSVVNTLSGQTITGGGGNIAAALTTAVGADAKIIYTYHTPTTNPSSKVHLNDDQGNEVVGIVCDNLSGMDDNSTAKDKLAISLDFPTVTDLTATVTAAGPNTNDTGSVKTLSDGKTYYIPPDEYNENQVPQDVTKDITKSATRTVTLTLHLTSEGRQYVIVKPIILARTPVVLVHGINNDPTAWNPFISNITGMDNYGNEHNDAAGAPIAVIPFVAVNHSDPTTFIGGLSNGNGPAELGAILLSERIQKMVASVHTGTSITDHDENGYSLNIFNNEQHSFDGYLNLPLAIKRVDVVAWSYGGVITRWYLNTDKPADTTAWYQRPFLYIRNLKGTIYTYTKGSVSNAIYQHNVRKVITLGSMWRGVPLVNFLNEDTFAEDSILNNGINFHTAPNMTRLVDAVREAIKTNVPSLEAMAINSPWQSQMIYDDPFQNKIGPPFPRPFDPDIAYGSVAGDDNAYLFGFGDLNILTDQIQRPSWFPYLGLEYIKGVTGAYSDGLVPLWSAAIPNPNNEHKAHIIVHSPHNGFADSKETREYVSLALNSTALPKGDLLNNAWQSPIGSHLSSFDGTKSWTFSPNEMAPDPESVLYSQVGGIGRLNSQALGGPGRTYPGVVKPKLIVSLGRLGNTTLVNVSFTNPGSVLIPDVQITGVTIQVGSVITLNPNAYSLGTVLIGGSANRSVPFTSSLGASGTPAIVKINYTYALSNGSAPVTLRLKLP